MKKITLLKACLLGLFVATLTLGFTACGSTGQESLRYQKIEGEEAYRVMGIGTVSDYDVVIPETYRGLPVTEIGAHAFENEQYISSITIGDNMTTIGEEAFYDCDSLTSVAIGGSVTSIGNGAFYDCDSLTSVVIPDSVTSIGNGAFEDCNSLTEVAIGNSVTSIGNCTFLSCNSLTSVEIPDSVTSIGYCTFLSCNSLTSIEVSADNTAYQSIDGNLYTKDGKTLLQYAIGKTATSFTIPDSVTSIGYFAFYDCSSLTSVVIGGGVTSIGGNAFGYCSSLTSVYYKGTASEWSAISIDSGNSPLKNATRYYYSETEPTSSGNYWHYVDGVPVKW